MDPSLTSYLFLKFISLKPKIFLKKSLQTCKRMSSYFLTERKIPETLCIELSNLCNSNCIFCAYKYDFRKKMLMSENHFRKAVDQFRDIGGKAIVISPLLGESLIDPNMLNRIEYIRDRGFKTVELFSNLTLLHKFDLARFLQSGITYICISTAPLSPQPYEEIYRNMQYGHLIMNIHNLLKAFCFTSKKTIKHIEISFRGPLSLQKCVETPNYRKYVEPYLCENISLSCLNEFDSWNDVIKQRDLMEGMKIKSADFSKRIPCRRLYVVQCDANGSLRLCGCRINPITKDDELYLGHISKDTILEVYSSSKVKRIITGFLKNDLPMVCRKCSWYSV